MMITDVIREAASEHEIYFLLTSYVDAIRYCDRLGGLPPSMRALPLGGPEDIRTRLENLSGARAGDQGPGHAAIAEAIDVFETALRRLDSVAGERAELRAA